MDSKKKWTIVSAASALAVVLLAGGVIASANAGVVGSVVSDRTGSTSTPMPTSTADDAVSNADDNGGDRPAGVSDDGTSGPTIATPTPTSDATSAPSPIPTAESTHHHRHGADHAEDDSDDSGHHGGDDSGDDSGHDSDDDNSGHGSGSSSGSSSGNSGDDD